MEKDKPTLSSNNQYEDMPTYDFQSVRELLAHGVDIARDEQTDVFGMSTGWDTLDQLLGGIRPRTVCVMGARPSMGLTTFAVSMALQMAVCKKYRVAYISLQEGWENMSERIADMILGAGALRRLAGMYTQSIFDKNDDFLKKYDLYMNKVNENYVALENVGLYFTESNGMLATELGCHIKRMIKSRAIQIVFVDYLQLLIGKDGTDFSEETVIESMRMLERMAKEHNIAIVALSMLDRSTETRGGSKVPLLWDLYGSGVIEAIAAQVLFLYCPEYYEIYEDMMGDTNQMAEIHVAKNRFGKPGMTRMRFNHEYRRFEEFANTCFVTNLDATNT